MSRRKAAAADSLDLLLDTICNTFGGVLFIAMLVIILANVSGNSAGTVPPTATAQQQLAKAHEDLIASQQELDTLRRAALEQSQLARLFSDPRLKTLVAQSSTQQSTMTAAAAARASHLQDAAEAQAEANRVAQALQALDTALANTRNQLAIVQQQLAAERQLRTRTAALPKLRKTSKRQIAFLLKGGRLHGYLHIDGGRTVRATAETREVTEGNATYLEPVPGGGTPVDPAGDKSGQLAQRFADWNPQQHFISISVWPDSFGHFPLLRQLLVERGFEYQLMPLPEGERVKLSDAPVSSVVQ